MSTSLKTVLQGEPESEGNLEQEVPWNWSELLRRPEITLSDIDSDSESDSEWTPDSEEEMDEDVSTDEGESESESDGEE